MPHLKVITLDRVGKVIKIRVPISSVSQTSEVSSTKPSRFNNPQALFSPELKQVFNKCTTSQEHAAAVSLALELLTFCPDDGPQNIQKIAGVLGSTDFKQFNDLGCDYQSIFFDLLFKVKGLEPTSYSIDEKSLNEILHGISLFFHGTKFHNEALKEGLLPRDRPHEVEIESLIKNIKSVFPNTQEKILRYSFGAYGSESEEGTSCNKIYFTNRLHNGAIHYANNSPEWFDRLISGASTLEIAKQNAWNQLCHAEPRLQSHAQIKTQLEKLVEKYWSISRRKPAVFVFDSKCIFTPEMLSQYFGNGTVKERLETAYHFMDRFLNTGVSETEFNNDQSPVTKDKLLQRNLRVYYLPVFEDNKAS